MFPSYNHVFPLSFWKTKTKQLFRNNITSGRCHNFTVLWWNYVDWIPTNRTNFLESISTDFWPFLRLISSQFSPIFGTQCSLFTFHFYSQRVCHFNINSKRILRTKLTNKMYIWCLSVKFSSNFADFISLTT